MKTIFNFFFAAVIGAFGGWVDLQIRIKIRHLLSLWENCFVAGDGNTNIFKEIKIVGYVLVLHLLCVCLSA